MADTAGQADIRGIDVDTLAKGFAEEDIGLKRFVTMSTTKAREIRWYSKTAGFLTGSTTTGMTGELIGNAAEKALPTVVNQSWTRNTSYVKKWFVTSELLSEEDIMDSDIDVLGTMVRDLTRAVQWQVNKRIYQVITESDTPVNINTAAATAPWNTTSYTNVNIIKDLMTGKTNIRTYSYDPEGAILLLSPLDHQSLLTWLIDAKGSSIPAFSSQKIETGVVMEILGLKVVVSTVVTADKAVIFIPQTSCTWKTFQDTTAEIINDPLLGKRIRVAEWGEGLLVHPRSVHFISNTQA